LADVSPSVRIVSSDREEVGTGGAPTPVPPALKRNCRLAITPDLTGGERQQAGDAG
jgi:hypothetical protein